MALCDPFKQQSETGEAPISIVAHPIYLLDLVSLSGCMNDSAGKFCPDKWTRKVEERRVEGKGDEELPHEDEKEDQNGITRPTAGTHTRSDQSDRSGEFSEGNAGHATARCARLDVSGCRLC